MGMFVRVRIITRSAVISKINGLNWPPAAIKFSGLIVLSVSAVALAKCV